MDTFGELKVESTMHKHDALVSCDHEEHALYISKRRRSKSHGKIDSFNLSVGASTYEARDSILTVMPATKDGNFTPVLDASNMFGIRVHHFERNAVPIPTK